MTRGWSCRQSRCHPDEIRGYRIDRAIIMANLIIYVNIICPLHTVLAWPSRKPTKNCVLCFTFVPKADLSESTRTSVDWLVLQHAIQEINTGTWTSHPHHHLHPKCLDLWPQIEENKMGSGTMSGKRVNGWSSKEQSKAWPPYLRVCGMVRDF